MKTLNFSEVSEESLFLFTFCYENNLNFGRLYRLYNLSKKVFWGYLGALTPILKIGVKKVNSYENLAHKIMNKEIGTPFVELDEREQHIYNLYRLFVEDVFVNARCSSIKTRKDLIGKKLNAIIDVNQGYESVYIGENFNIMRIREVELNGTTYYRTSRIETILNRYFPDMSMSEVNKKTIKEFEQMIEKVREEKGKVFANCK